MKIHVIKKQNDPIALRISIGGDLETAYFVYRGDLVKVKALLAEVADEISHLENEPKLSDDMGKDYA